MFQVLRSHDRGHFNHGWLDTFHTFSFGDYYNPAYTQFRALRVMNEDRVEPGQGFGMHGHRDMEIVTYVLEGALEHRDSLGNGEVLRPGELQRMTAGTGIRHSEFNPSKDEPVHLYQIWLLPERPGLPPSYEQKSLDGMGQTHGWRLIASPGAEQGALRIHQDARLQLAKTEPGQSLQYELLPGRHAWLQVLRGNVTSGGNALVAGDGMAVSDETRLSIESEAACEVLLFDLA